MPSNKPPPYLHPFMDEVRSYPLDGLFKMPKVTSSKLLQVVASVWKLGKSVTHNGKEHSLSNYEQCREFAKLHGYSGITIIYR